MRMFSLPSLSSFTSSISFMLGFMLHNLWKEWRKF
jgi:hypothetical protein